MDYEQFIEINPSIRFGKPCIKGTRITVQDILEMVASEMSFAQIMEEFPQLTTAKIKAALLFAASRERSVKMVAA
jgi:uncharacterized protein (DUF433 family)